MTIVIPRMGESTDLYRDFFKEIGIDCVLPRKITKRTLELGNERMDELMCMPAKVVLGNFREALEDGHKTLVMWDTCGECRFKCYWALHKQILKKLGYEFEIVPINKRNFIPTLFHLNGNRLNPYKLMKAGIKTYNKFKEIEKDKLKKNGINIGIVGEIYTILTPDVNMGLFKKLESFGAGYKNYVTNIELFKETFKLKRKSKFEKEAAEYMPHKRSIGGHGFQSIVHLLEAIEEGLDGVIHIMPFPCSPESVISPILDIIAEKYNDFPLIHLIFDEHTGEAGIETRLESFVDMIELRKKGITKFKKIQIGKRTKKGVIALDCGSVSTKAGLMNERGELVKHIYIETKGDPIEATKKCLKYILKDKVEVTGFGVTGSSRKLIGKIFNADLVKNEITAQVTGCLNQHKGINTILEIGGQDSKGLILKKEIPIYYNLNNLCAAGTGSFLSHQAKRMGMSIQKFADCGMKSECPVKIAGRCTVFSETDLIHKQAYTTKEDQIAGLNRALTITFMKTVMKNRKLEPPIFFSGGVSCNKGVVKAFKNYLGEEIIVSEFSKLIGMMGILLLTKEKITKEKIKTKFRKDVLNLNIERKRVDCDGCGNQCDVTLVYGNGKFIDKFNDMCGDFKVGK